MPVVISRICCSACSASTGDSGAAAHSRIEAASLCTVTRASSRDPEAQHQVHHAEAAALVRQRHADMRIHAQIGWP
jgi:hypothetical protein